MMKAKLHDAISIKAPNPSWSPSPLPFPPPLCHIFYIAAGLQVQVVREAAWKKSGLTLELSQRGGGGGQGLIQSKRSTFCHIQVPTRISFILPHIHGGASLFIPHKFYPWTLTMCWVIKKSNIKNVDLKSAPGWSKVQGGGVKGALGKFQS